MRGLLLEYFSTYSGWSLFDAAEVAASEMDPITAATTVFTFVAFVQEMQQLAQKVKESMEKASSNRKKLRALCTNSIKHLVELEQVTRAHENDVLISQELQDALTELRDELERIYRRCAMRIEPPKKGPAGIWSRIKAWKGADGLEADMLVFENNIRACEMRFLTSAMVRFEKNAHVQTHVLYAMGDEQRTAFDQIGQAIREGLPQAQQELPHEVILRQTSADFVAHKGIVARPSRIATLSDEEKTEMASRSIDVYLELLKGIFTRPATFASLSKNCGQMEPYSYTPHYYSTDDPSQQTKDTLVEISWILKMFRSPHPQITASDCARHLHALAMTLADLGMYTEALMILPWAVHLFRDMYRLQPDIFTPYLARSLHFIGQFRVKLGQHSAALVATTEAVALFRQGYAADAQDGLAADLGMSLRMRSLALRRMGPSHHDEALSAVEEAISIFRRLADTREAFKSDLALVLIAQALQFDDEESRDKVFDCGHEAVELLSGMVENPHSCPPYVKNRLACALFVHGFHLFKAGRELDCLEVNERAITLYRAFFAARPKVWRLEYCDALNNQGWFFYSIGRHDDALRLSQEALDILRGIVTTANECGLFANILETPAAVYEAMGRLEDALQAVEEIVHTIYNYPAFQRRNARLAWALRWTARLLRALDRSQEAQLREDEAGLLEVEPDMRN